MLETRTDLRGSGAQRHKPVARVYAALTGLYVAQAIPLYLVAAALPPILRARGADLSVIGGLGILMLPWVVKAFWAPWIDRLSQHPRIGRKGVILAAQLTILAVVARLALLDPIADIGLFFPLLFVMSLASATQDIASDGYAVEHLPPQAQSGGNAIQSSAVAAGVLFGGSGTLVLYELAGWQTAVLTAGICSMIAVTAFLTVPEHLGRRIDTDLAQQQQRPRLRRFFARPGAWAALGFALIFRLPEGLIKALEQSFLVDAGFSLSLIGLISGGSAAVVGLVGAGLGMLVINRWGLGLFFAMLVALRTLIFALFALAAMQGMPHEVLVALSMANTFCRYMEITGLYTAFMRVSSLSQAGTDFTILSSANLLVYMTGSMAAGVMAQALGYALVFWTACALSLVTGMAALVLLAKSHPERTKLHKPA
ncbi:MFS transporter [Phaeobacter sp. QD34_3]|uniref:MFS transporter n=1 Tax=unclassified Phaeobacter TaxID=2621772 RepID=UPI00237F57BA|nr:MULTISPECIES: MFS transporter [unclassified Phaeobacter]MDE4134821.1 MFS transporter [Phaeobacter sp. QD34_3]MDE4137730.1 MFS transporter [Phaeobacter sp. QD34_24]